MAATVREDLEEHVRYCQARFEAGDAVHHKLIEGQAETAKQMSELVAAVTKLTTSTEGVVRTYNDLMGAARVGTKLQAICVWLLKWGAIGAAVVAAIRWAAEHRPL